MSVGIQRGGAKVAARTAIRTMGEHEFAQMCLRLSTMLGEKEAYLIINALMGIRNGFGE